MWKQLIWQKGLPPAVCSHHVMLSASSVTQVWKHQNSLCNLPLSVQYKDLACSLPSLLHTNSICSPKKETPSPKWPLGLMWTDTGGHNLLLFTLHIGIEAELAWNVFWCGSLPAWRKLLPQPSAWSECLFSCSSRLKTNYICRWRLSPEKPAEKVQKDFVVTWVKITTAEPSSSPL